MIHHVSIPAENPYRVAQVLAELLDGTLTAFGPYPNAFIAWSHDDPGTAIEVMPAGTELIPHPGEGQAQFRHHPRSSHFTATHLALSVSRSEDEILALAHREGWRALRLSRGSNDVIEFWIENRLLLEVMTPAMASDYTHAARESFPRKTTTPSPRCSDRQHARWK
ncbi:MAG: hypothetical protein RLZZ142_1182 [Verrucomicrobiota bacterium]|jgi:hypothetical protein